MQKYSCTVLYDGKSFNGFQSQSDGSGIQDTLESALSTFLRHKTRLRGSSRTDSGVHAEGQHIAFETDVAFQPAKWKRGINAILPSSIAIRNLKPVPPEFDPIYHSVGKTYRYRLWQGNCDNPVLRPYVLDVYPHVVVPVLREEIKAFHGTHDFTSFCNSDSDAQTKVRTIVDSHIEDLGPLVNIWIQGEGFLKQMVRIMVGTLVRVAQGKLPPGSVAEILSQQQRSVAGATALAKGLTLVETHFQQIPPLASVIAKSNAGFSIAVD